MSTKKFMVCGVDCHKGDANCNGYCTGAVSHPPAATQEHVLKWAREHAQKKLREAETAWYEYFGQCEVGQERTNAAEVYERIRNAARIN